MITLEYVAASALALVLLVAAANLLVDLYVRAAVRDALDEGVRAAVPVGASAADCTARANDTLHGSWAATFARAVTIRCDVGDGEAHAAADVALPAFLSWLPVWTFGVHARHARRTRREQVHPGSRALAPPGAGAPPLACARGPRGRAPPLVCVRGPRGRAPPLVCARTPGAVHPRSRALVGVGTSAAFVRGRARHVDRPAVRPGALVGRAGARVERAAACRDGRGSRSGPNRRRGLAVLCGRRRHRRAGRLARCRLPRATAGTSPSRRWSTTGGAATGVAHVSVLMPVLHLPLIGDAGGWHWSTTYAVRIDDYRSR